jgi:putative transposase
VTRELRKWLARRDTRTLDGQPGVPWEKDYRETFNGKLSDECLNREIVYSLKEG